MIEKTPSNKVQKERMPNPAGWFARGRKRALSGKSIMSDEIHTHFNGKATKEDTTEYQFGYMSGVLDILEEEGITNPEDLGIAESFMHVVIGSNAGVLGFRDGRKGKDFDKQSYEVDGQKGHIHYRDGYRIGFAFTRALSKKGIFDSYHYSESDENRLEISDGNKKILTDDVRVWLKNCGIENFDPEIIMNMRYYVRDGFAFYLNMSSSEPDVESEIEKHIAYRKHQMKTSTRGFGGSQMTQEEISAALSDIVRGITRAKNQIDIRDKIRSKYSGQIS